MKLRRLQSVLVLLVVLLLGPHGASAAPQPPAGPPRDPHIPFNPVAVERGRPWPTLPAESRVPARPQVVTPAAPNGIDLDVTYIERSPTYWAYCVQYNGGVPLLCPGTESERRWPAPGEIVTFTARVINKGAQSSGSYAYNWAIDGTVVASGQAAGLAPDAEATFSYQWAWGHQMDGERVLDDHAVRFSVDPSNAIAETYESNNSLQDRTNAIAFEIGITPDMYAAYNTPLNPAFSYSTEDWLQRQIAAMNNSFAGSSYAGTTPAGVTERVRINRIVVTSSSPVNRGTSDGGWFVDADYRYVSGGYDAATDIDWNLVHELSHQVGLIDLYNLNIESDSTLVTDAADRYSNMARFWPRSDLMGGGDIAPHTDDHLYSSHSAGGISSTRGYRRGYYGEYQYDLPARSSILLLDAAGQPAAGVEVALFQRTTETPDGLIIDDAPEITGVTGADGRFALPNRAVAAAVTTATGHALRDNPFGTIDVVGVRNVFLARLRAPSHEEFRWLDVTELNLAYWSGHTEDHTIEWNTHLPVAGAPQRPHMLAPKVEGRRASVCWQPVAGAAGYELYRATRPEYTYSVLAAGLTGTCYEDAHDSARIYAVASIDGGGRRSGFSHFAWAPRLINPSGVAVFADGGRIVLDPQNGHALLSMGANGHYERTVGSVHTHFENSRFLSVGAEENLLISHPGDDYSSRHSVRVLDRNGRLLQEFGERGSGPGQFETPTGVAAWGDPCAVPSPPANDPHTLLLLNWDGTYTGAQGEPGTPSGTAFAAAHSGQGVQVDGNDTLFYDAAGNIDRLAGSIEFWYRPDQPGNDYQTWNLAEIGNTWFNRMLVTKDGANNLRFLVWDNSHEYGVGANVADWQAGEWRHIAVSWSAGTIWLYVNGELRDAASGVGMPGALADRLYIGSSTLGDRQAKGVFDEFRVSNIARVGNSDTCNYRLLVADSGNHRLQVFDGDGTYLSSFGAYGSGAGQFKNPQGVASTTDGRVLVADAGNGRVQVFTFDGVSFQFVRALTGFSNPVGVAGGPKGRMVVTDAGAGKVFVYGPDAAPQATYTAPNDEYTGAFGAPQAASADPAGRLVVADRDQGRVVTVRGAFPGPDLTAHSQFLSLILNWSSAGGATETYDVWRTTDAPYFAPGESGATIIASDLSPDTLTFTDETGELGNAERSSYYRVTSAQEGDWVSASDAVGEFEFDLLR